MANSPVPTQQTPPQVELESAPATNSAWLPRLLLIIIPVLLVLIGLAVAAYVFLGPEKIMSQLDIRNNETTAEDFIPEDIYLLEFDVITADLFSSPGESRLVSVSMAIDTYSDLESAEAEKRKPIIEDAVVSFLRGLRPDDFVGSSGLERIRDEITLRVVEVLRPIRVRSVFIRNISFSS